MEENVEKIVGWIGKWRKRREEVGEEEEMDVVPFDGEEGGPVTRAKEDEEGSEDSGSEDKEDGDEDEEDKDEDEDED